MFKLSNKKGIKGEILSQVLEKAGIEVIINSNLSERLCKPCAAKLRRTCEGMINVVNPKFVAVNTRSWRSSQQSSIRRSKRALPSSVSIYPSFRTFFYISVCYWKRKMSDSTLNKYLVPDNGGHLCRKTALHKQKRTTDEMPFATTFHPGLKNLKKYLWKNGV